MSCLGDMSIMATAPICKNTKNCGFAPCGRGMWCAALFVRGLRVMPKSMAIAAKFAAMPMCKNRVEKDIYYLENWSFGLDILIILKTIQHCIFPPANCLLTFGRTDLLLIGTIIGFTQGRLTKPLETTFLANSTGEASTGNSPQ